MATVLEGVRLRSLQLVGLVTAGDGKAFQFRCKPVAQQVQLLEGGEWSSRPCMHASH